MNVKGTSCQWRRLDYSQFCANGNFKKKIHPIFFSLTNDAFKRDNAKQPTSVDTHKLSANKSTKKTTQFGQCSCVLMRA